MSFKKVTVTFSALALVFSIAGNEKRVENEVTAVQNRISNVVKRVANNDLFDDMDSNSVFQLSIENYQEKFSEYLNIAGLNVSDKDAISLENYDEQYVAPDFSEVLCNYQTNLESGLTPLQLERYESLRMNDYNFDRYVTLNATLYKNLEISLKYSHATIPTNPDNPITPLNPGVGLGGGSTIKVASLAATGIVSILTGAGLTKAVISAFTSCVSTMTIGLSSSWIPFIGWALAVGLIVGALIAITVIIIENWDKICSVFNDIKEWFKEQFSVFSSLIETYFADASSKVESSKISSVQTIGDKTFEFSEVKSDDVTTQISIAEKARRNYDVFLMLYVKPESLQIAIGVPVDEEFCVEYKTHALGFSSYTWYQNTARRLIITAGSGYTTTKPELHLYNAGVNKYSKYAFNHFHNYDASGKRIEGTMHWTHSMFGLLYWTENDDGVGTVHPLSPKN